MIRKSRRNERYDIDYATYEDVELGNISDEDYLNSFEYIYSSKVNGNISQYKNQLKRLLKEGRLRAYQNYLDEYGLDGEIVRFLESKKGVKMLRKSRRNEGFEYEWEEYQTGVKGSFMKSLAHTFDLADSKNLRKLASAFPEIYEIYKEFHGDVLKRFESKRRNESKAEELKKIFDDAFRGGKMNCFETAGGVVYFEPQGEKLVFGGATNAGIIPQYEFEYDFDHSFDWNLQGMIEQIMEEEGYPMDESKKRPLRKYRKSESEWSNSPTAKQFYEFADKLAKKLHLSDNDVRVNADEMPMEVNFNFDDKKVRVEFFSEHIDADKHIFVYIEDTDVRDFEYKPSKEPLDKAVERVVNFIKTV